MDEGRALPTSSQSWTQSYKSFFSFNLTILSLAVWLNFSVASIEAEKTLIGFGPGPLARFLVYEENTVPCLFIEFIIHQKRNSEKLPLFKRISFYKSPIIWVFSNFDELVSNWNNYTWRIKQNSFISPHRETLLTWFKNNSLSGLNSWFLRNTMEWFLQKVGLTIMMQLCKMVT